jgi:hypothetical protein
LTGKPLSNDTVQRLRALLERQRQFESQFRAATDELYAAVLEVCENEGASRAGVAQALEVGTSTVQGWIVRGRQLARN